jgi:hypothetical protein
MSSITTRSEAGTSPTAAPKSPTKKRAAKPGPKSPGTPTRVQPQRAAAPQSPPQKPAPRSPPKKKPAPKSAPKKKKAAKPPQKKAPSQAADKKRWKRGRGKRGGKNKDEPNDEDPSIEETSDEPVVATDDDDDASVDGGKQDDETTNEPVVITGETTNEPVVETGGVDGRSIDETTNTEVGDAPSASSKESTELSVSADDDLPAGDESKESTELSVSADDDLPAGDESKESTELSVSADDDLPATEPLAEEVDKPKIPPAAVAPTTDVKPDSEDNQSRFGDSTTSEESDGKATDPSYPEARGLANIISQSQPQVPPAVASPPPSPVRSMRKEIKFWSANLEKPYFLHKTDPFEFPHYRFPALPGHKLHFQPTETMWKNYDKYFAGLSTNPLPEDQIVAKIGHQTVTVKGLNSLKQGEWLRGDILSAYLDLLGNEVYHQNREDKNPPKMAVFDNQFLTNLVNFHDAYDYKSARASGTKRLRGRCPSDFEVLLFFCNKDFQHYINLAIYPGLRLICVIDSYGYTADKYAGYIFRWLYDEMHFNWLERAKKLFMAYEPCMGWTYRVDPKCKKQSDGYECGVWTIANASCMMLNLNMSVLTEKVITNFRKLIFARLSLFSQLVPRGEPKIRDAAPWYRGPQHLKLPPLEMVTSLDTRPTETALPSVRSNMEFGDLKERAIEARLYRAVYAKEMKEKKRQEREAEKKKEEDELAAEKAEQKKEADEKIAQQARRVAADEKVNEMLQKKGFATQVIARGAAAEKRQKQLLDKAFAVPEQDEAQLLADQEERATSKNRRVIRDAEDQVAYLVFKRGTTGKDPPDNKTKNISKITYGSGASGEATQVFMYNFFLGRTASGKVFDYQLSPEWVEYVFNLVFTQLIRRFPGTWFHVPIGSAVVEEEPSSALYMSVSPTDRKTMIIVFRMPWHPVSTTWDIPLWRWKLVNKPPIGVNCQVIWFFMRFEVS